MKTKTKLDLIAEKMRVAGYSFLPKWCVMITREYYNGMKISLCSMANVVRAVKVAQLSPYYLRLIPSDGITQEDVEVVSRFLYHGLFCGRPGGEFIPQIICGITKNYIGSLTEVLLKPSVYELSQYGGESFEDVIAEIRAAKKHVVENDKLDRTCITFLQTFVDRGFISPIDGVIKAVNVSKGIAKLNKCNRIKTEHIAEAMSLLKAPINQNQQTNENI